MAMCVPALELIEACFEKCSLGLGGQPKPLSALALCIGDNFRKIQRQEQACPVPRALMSSCQECFERNDCFWEKLKVPEQLAQELKAYFGDGVNQFSHQLEALAKGGDPKTVQIEFPLTWLLARYKWDVPTAIPLSAPDRDVNVLVAYKGHQSMVVAPVVGEGLEDMADTAVLSFHEHIKEGEEFQPLRDIFSNSTVSNLSVLLTKDLGIPPVRAGAYSWLISAYVFPYLLRSDDIEGFLSTVNGVSREEFLQVAQPLEVDVLVK